jgi:hypothetical protein
MYRIGAAPTGPPCFGGSAVASAARRWPTTLYDDPEARARIEIDAQFVPAGWAVQDRGQINLAAARSVEVREFLLATGFAVQWRNALG